MAAFCCLDQMGGVRGADASSAIPNAITDSTAAGTIDRRHLSRRGSIRPRENQPSQSEECSLFASVTRRSFLFDANEQRRDLRLVALAAIAVKRKELAYLLSAALC